MQNRLTVGLKGGMGNQLFQYFAAAEFSRLNDRELVIDISWYKRNIHSNGLLNPRQFVLDQYSFHKDLEIINEFTWQNSPITERIFRRIPNRLGIRAGVAFELKRGAEIPHFLSNAYLSGYWIKNPILPPREELREKLVEGILTPSLGYFQLREELQNNRVIAIHIRLGDYLNFREVYGVTNESYYVNAIREIANAMVGNTSGIWLFSDDPVAAAELVSSSLKIDKVINDSYGLNEAESIALISAASGIVGSNSTFSWWASYLSKEDLTQVVMPKKYMRGTLMKDTGLYVSDWLYL
jgi:hypothetical protein